MKCLVVAVGLCAIGHILCFRINNNVQILYAKFHSRLHLRGLRGAGDVTMYRANSLFVVYLIHIFFLIYSWQRTGAVKSEFALLTSNSIWKTWSG